MKNRLKEYRARYGYSQEKLATLIGVTRQTIGFIEKQKMLPSVLLAIKLAKVFQCKVEELFLLEEGDEDL
ncbi:helix-turn-helix transcriptional regulator [Gracilibacillus dipsosauri]|uniref:Transcriptional regulator n=1 Tax=Gracilibacillus dipsosauri TaxID=178340 RepID=A0A317KV06_9BACI|nr:helix-turn-helix transcriptional regulator [Gracilibacillus dipsosauri]PWU67297.1 transcriptional regulator [Gracilibacillus dipsosauri]